MSEFGKRNLTPEQQDELEEAARKAEREKTKYGDQIEDEIERDDDE